MSEILKANYFGYLDFYQGRRSELLASRNSRPILNNSQDLADLQF